MDSGEILASKDTEYLENDRFQDIVFEVDKLHLFPEQNEIFEISDTTRLSRSLSLLANTCPWLDFPKNVHSKILETKKAYLKGKISIGSEMISRNQLVNVNEAFSITDALLLESNHPASQLISQISHKYNSERMYVSELHRLQVNTITIVAWDTLHDVLESQITKKRQLESAGSIRLLAVELEPHTTTPAA